MVAGWEQRGLNLRGQGRPEGWADRAASENGRRRGGLE